MEKRTFNKVADALIRAGSRKPCIVFSDVNGEIHCAVTAALKEQRKDLLDEGITPEAINEAQRLVAADPRVLKIANRNFTSALAEHIQDGEICFYTAPS